MNCVKAKKEHLFNDTIHGIIESVEKEEDKQIWNKHGNVVGMI